MEIITARILQFNCGPEYLVTISKFLFFTKLTHNVHRNDKIFKNAVL